MPEQECKKEDKTEIMINYKDCKNGQEMYISFADDGDKLKVVFNFNPVVENNAMDRFGIMSRLFTLFGGKTDARPE
jgi:hypothetical protein